MSQNLLPVCLLHGPACWYQHWSLVTHHSFNQQLWLTFESDSTENSPMLRLDYLSCVLTVLSTVLIGRRRWQGWVVAGANSLVICYIGYRTSQTGFIPANMFCLAIYGYNVWQWRHRPALEQQPETTSATLERQTQPVHAPRRTSRPRHVPVAAHERPVRTRHRIRPRSLPHR